MLMPSWMPDVYEVYRNGEIGWNSSDQVRRLIRPANFTTFDFRENQAEDQGAICPAYTKL